MKKKIYRFLKILSGYILAANGSFLFANGCIYIYKFIDLCINKEKDIFESYHCRGIGYLPYNFIYLMGLTFVILGIHAIFKGGRIAEITGFVNKPVAKLKVCRKSIHPCSRCSFFQHQK